MLQVDVARQRRPVEHEAAVDVRQVPVVEAALVLVGVQRLVRVHHHEDEPAGLGDGGHLPHALHRVARVVERVDGEHHVEVVLVVPLRQLLAAQLRHPQRRHHPVLGEQLVVRLLRARRLRRAPSTSRAASFGSPRPGPGPSRRRARGCVRLRAHFRGGRRATWRASRFSKEKGVDALSRRRKSLVETAAPGSRESVPPRDASQWSQYRSSKPMPLDHAAAMMYPSQLLGAHACGRYF